MTNTGVGKVYEKVIQAVIDSSVTDFQDSGVDVSTLEELKKAWQEKLSMFGVASFPWDPELPKSPIPKAEDPTDAVGDLAADGTRIKADPDGDSLPPPPPPAPLGQPLSDPSIAAARAAQKVEMKFGAANQQKSSFPGLMLPSAPKPPLGGQTDGPEDIPLSRNHADEEIRRIVLEGDEIHSQEDALREAMRRFDIQSDVMQVRPLNRKRKAKQSTRDVDSTPGSTLSGLSTTPKIPQTDGPDMDEDLINSDLDDTDEEPVDDDDDGEGIPQIMLCMYDKVQRTKNKWKCVLKDGILTVGGREYVFRKANGEYEW